MNTLVDDEMALSEHIEEFSQRLIFCLVSLFLATIVCFADVKEIVGPILFLLSKDSSYINGHTIIVDGGMSSW